MVTSARRAKIHRAKERDKQEIAYLRTALDTVRKLHDTSRIPASAYRAARPSHGNGKGLSTGIASQYAPSDARSAVPSHVLPATDLSDYGGI